jgi:inosine-uridine nucleoside N-ribohydrolase
MKRFILTSISLLVVFVQACSKTPELVAIPPEALKPVIFDGDMAHEDMFAALFLLQHPNVDVKGITVVGTGEAHCAPGVENLRGIAALVGRAELPVTCGRETPLAGNHVFPEEWRRSADNAYGVELPAGSGTPPGLAAPEWIAQVVFESPQPVTIIAVGPLTNIAEALGKYPDIVANLAMIYVMGGAVDVGGNVGTSGVGIDNDVAEWNVYIDPVSANQVLASGVPFTLVPLDATSHVPITRRFYNTLGGWRDTPAAQFMYDVLTAEMGFVESGGFQFWDSFTAAVATDETLARFEPREIAVVEQEGPESGWTKPASGGYPVRVAVWGDSEKFEALLLTVLNRKAE